MDSEDCQNHYEEESGNVGQTNHVREIEYRSRVSHDISSFLNLLNDE